MDQITDVTPKVMEIEKAARDGGGNLEKIDMAKFSKEVGYIFPFHGRDLICSKIALQVRGLISVTRSKFLSNMRTTRLKPLQLFGITKGELTEVQAEALIKDLR